MVDGTTTRNPLVADYTEWKARDYFDTYYSEVVLPDEQAGMDASYGPFNAFLQETSGKWVTTSWL